MPTKESRTQRRNSRQRRNRRRVEIAEARVVALKDIERSLRDSLSEERARNDELVEQLAKKDETIDIVTRDSTVEYLASANNRVRITQLERALRDARSEEPEELVKTKLALQNIMTLCVGPLRDENEALKAKIESLEQANVGDGLHMGT